jgi:RND family efflux transporter MFP subunit
MSGRIDELAVTEHSSVSAGQVIARIGGAEQQAQLAEAKAQLAEANLQVEYTKKGRDRTQTLRDANVIPQADLDLAVHLHEQAVAKTASLRAGIARLQRMLDKAVVKAPTSGVVTTRVADQGEYVSAGTPLLTIVDLSQMRLEVEVGEFDLGRLSSSAQARIVAEGFDGQSWTGTVLETPKWVTSRRLKPLDPGRPSDTRVLLVQVSLPKDAPLRLGQRVEVELSVPESKTSGATTVGAKTP